ncbi:MAG: cob(I)yrinic acid a,c-diamide adenosyltransferase [Thermoprotei archaeon]|nr:MAG: cob(I)yrinic acid a,c-diamide adenosyltransferase [Thermoprotei archaeon]
MEKLGLVHIKTGDGPGKTTSAFGLALRAAGRGYRVYIVQFMKKGEYGELKAIKYVPNIEVEQFGREEFVDRERPEEEDVKLAQEALRRAEEVAMSGRYDLVILDEVNVAMDYGLIKVEDVLKLIRNKPSHVELVLTGRGAPEQVCEIADYVTEFKEIKHPWRRGISGRRGIEF